MPSVSRVAGALHTRETSIPCAPGFLRREPGCLRGTSPGQLEATGHRRCVGLGGLGCAGQRPGPPAAVPHGLMGGSLWARKQPRGSTGGGRGRRPASTLIRQTRRAAGLQAGCGLPHAKCHPPDRWALWVCVCPSSHRSAAPTWLTPRQNRIAPCGAPHDACAPAWRMSARRSAGGLRTPRSAGCAGNGGSGPWAPGQPAHRWARPAAGPSIWRPPARCRRLRAQHGAGRVPDGLPAPGHPVCGPGGRGGGGGVGQAQELPALAGEAPRQPAAGAPGGRVGGSGRAAPPCVRVGAGAA